MSAKEIAAAILMSIGLLLCAATGGLEYGMDFAEGIVFSIIGCAFLATAAILAKIADKGEE